MSKYIIIKHLKLLVKTDKTEISNNLVFDEETPRILCSELKFIHWNPNLLEINENRNEYSFGCKADMCDIDDTKVFSKVLQIRKESIFECDSDEEAELIYEAL